MHLSVCGVSGRGGASHEVYIGLFIRSSIQSAYCSPNEKKLYNKVFIYKPRLKYRLLDQLAMALKDIYIKIFVYIRVHVVLSWNMDQHAAERCAEASGD